MRKILFPIVFMAAGLVLAAAVSAQSNGAKESSSNWQASDAKVQKIPFVDYSPPSLSASNELPPIVQAIDVIPSVGYSRVHQAAAQAPFENDQTPQYDNGYQQNQNQFTHEYPNANQSAGENDQAPPAPEFNDTRPRIAPGYNEQPSSSNQQMQTQNAAQPPAFDDFVPSQDRYVELIPSPEEIWRLPESPYPPRSGDLFPRPTVCDEWAGFCPCKRVTSDCGDKVVAKSPKEKRGERVDRRTDRRQLRCSRCGTQNGRCNCR